jgi:hypothetical protein
MTSATLDDILLAVQRVTRTGVRDIKGDGQSANVRDARLLFYFVAHQCFEKLSANIAKKVERHKDTVRQQVAMMLKTPRFSTDLIDAVEYEVEKIVAARQATNTMEMR